jgi:hypothetical protein
MQIKTNNQPRPALYWYDLTDKERAELDYLDTETARDDFRGFRYKGAVYDLGEFSVIRTSTQQARSLSMYAHTAEDDSPLAEWHAIQTDSYFSGVVVKISRDGDDVTVGLATW